MLFECANAHHRNGAIGDFFLDLIPGRSRGVEHRLGLPSGSIAAIRDAERRRRVHAAHNTASPNRENVRQHQHELERYADRQ